MIARRSGHIINIASLSGLIPVPAKSSTSAPSSVWSASTPALADEVAPHGVDVSVIMPPFTNTELISGTKTGGTIKPVEPEDIAAAVIKTLEKPKTHGLRADSAAVHRQAAQMLGPRGRRWLNKKLGLDSVFLTFDRDRTTELRAARPGRSGRHRGSYRPSSG